MPDFFNNTGLTHEDYGRGSVIQRGKSRRIGIPEFALSNDLRKVLAARAWGLLHSHKPIPPEVEMYWKALDVACTERAAAQLRKNPNCPVAQRLHHSTLFAGTYLSGQCAVAYAAWRLGLSDADIAEQFGISGVGMMLNRLIRIAEKLGLPTRRYSPLKGRRKKPPRPRKTTEEISAARSAGAYRFWARRKAAKENAQPKPERTHHYPVSCSPAVSNTSEYLSKMVLAAS